VPRTRVPASSFRHRLRPGQGLLAGDLIEYPANGAHRVAVLEFLEQEPRLVELRLGLIEVAEVGQHVALIGQHPRPTHRVAVAIAGPQHGLVEFDGLDEVVGLVIRRGVDQRVGQVQLHAGPLLGIVLGGVDLQRRAQRLCGHPQPQLSRRLRHRHGQIRGCEVGVRCGPQQRGLLTQHQLECRVVVRHRAHHQVRPVLGLLVQQPRQPQMHLGARNAQTIGTLEGLECPLESHRSVVAARDRRRSPQQDAAQSLLQRKAVSRKRVANELAAWVPARLADAWVGMGAAWGQSWERPINEVPDKALTALAERLSRWELRPTGTEGYRKAEVTAGGVDTAALSSQTMESNHSGLYCIGEVVDVTGWLGGYNF
ncbi:MAG: hypothetical protein EBU23_18035, partial [Mycobacteriaceae bacterium]|nr:hypothetical protein [Mycobacteriaceae bacterium]